MLLWLVLLHRLLSLLPSVLKALVVGQGVASAVVLVADVALVLVGGGGGVLIADVGGQVRPFAQPLEADGTLLLPPGVHCKKHIQTLVNMEASLRLSC